MVLRDLEGTAVGPLEPLEPRLLLSSAPLFETMATEVLSDLAGTQVSVPAETQGTSPELSDASVSGTDLTWTGGLDVLVEPGLLSAIQPAIDVYSADLAAEGYAVTAQEFSGNAQDLRAHLQDRYASADIEGALLVGDMPTLTFRNDHDFDDKTVSYLHDLYFMDLDGEYVLNGSDPDEHFDGTGDVGPEIYVSRITTSPITGMTGRSEAELIVDYFDRVHDYRTGGLYYADRSVLWADDDWHWTEYKLGDLYDEHLVITEDADTTRQSYLGTLTLNYESMLELIHSSVTYHQIHGTGGGKVTSADIHDLNPRIGFYNMWNCSSAKFTSSNNLISTYTYAGDWGLNAVGSTKTGSMLTTYHFYDDQAAGLSVGQAFANTMDRYAAETTTDGTSSTYVNWYYGMTMQGDPTLVPALMGDGAPRVTGHTPAGGLPGPQDSLDLTFSKPMDPATFRLAEDLVSFTGPGGADLLGELTGASWTDAQTLRLSYRPQTTPGTYSLTLSAALADLNGRELNQDGDEICGETYDDRYVASFEILNAAPAVEITSPTVAGVWMQDESNLLLLEASVSDDGFGGGPLTHTWSLAGGPTGATAQFEDASATSTAVRFSQAGEYTLRITAHDGTDSAADEVTVTIGDPGQAVAQPDVLWYTFDEGSGQVATDATGQGRDGIISGATWSAGQSGGALQFAGDGRVLDDDAEDYLNGLDAITVTGWIRADYANTDMGWIVGRDPSNGDDVLGIRYDKAGASGGGTDGIKIGMNVSGQTIQLESSSGVQTTDWQFVAFTWASGSEIHLYIDGQLDTPTHHTSVARGTLSDVTKLQIGQPPKDNPWSGLIDDVRIYSRALSADEIAALYNGAPPNIAALVDAGADTQIESNEIALAGSANDDGNPADPGTVLYRWQLLDGPGQAYFADETDPASAVNVDTFGRYTFRLTADDGQVVTADDVSVILAPTGDVDFNGRVDFNDAWTMMAHYLSPGDKAWEQGDFNADNVVDAADGALLQDNWGTDLTGLLASAGPYDPPTLSAPETTMAAEPLSVQPGQETPPSEASPPLVAGVFQASDAPSPWADADIAPASSPRTERVASPALLSSPAGQDEPTEIGTSEGSAWGTATARRRRTPASLDAAEDVLGLTAELTVLP